MSSYDLESYSKETNDSIALANEMMVDVVLPPQPTFVVAVSKEITKPEPDYNHICNLVSQDPAMVAKLLTLINSPLFSFNRRISSVDAALSLLGLRKFYSLVLTSVAKEVLGFEGKDVEKLWEHSLLVAKLCDGIAGKVRRISSEEAYLIGLFHDAAIPILLTAKPEYNAVLEHVIELGGDIQALEEKKFNTHHALVGAVLTRSWGLPRQVFTVIRYHHDRDLDAFDEDTIKKQAAVLMLGDELARCVKSAKQPHQNEQCLKLLDQIKQTLDFSDQDIEELHQLACTLAADSAVKH